LGNPTATRELLVPYHAAHVFAIEGIVFSILRARADLWGMLILKKTIREGIFFKVCA
jgi:hypothetical protein